MKMKSVLLNVAIGVACVSAAGAQIRPRGPVPPPEQNMREQRVRQVLGELALDEGQREELRRRLRTIDAGFDTVLIAENKAARALAEFRGAVDTIGKEERRAEPCLGRCKEFAKTYETETSKLRGAYDELQGQLRSFVDFVNVGLSPQQRQTVYRFVDDELSLAALRRSVGTPQRAVPQEDPELPPYPRARTPVPSVRETTAIETKPAPRLREATPGVKVPARVVQKQIVKGPIRGRLVERLGPDDVLALFRGVPTRRAAGIMKEVSVLAEKILETR